ncbi:unnamed protein product [Brachionus calyciflorus]|uniref:CFA20 domain-containing protein n=1 Tax=Brachionus calyciflorus TaxID=104777 RepID=A0A813UKN7_9BILA|nr:unnamed protein product [Brachionus calyciflorus]
MFKNEFQGGNFFEIFNPSTKDPLNSFKLTGSHGIQKIFDKDVKGSVYQLDGSPATTKITLPKDTKQGLSLVQRIIVFQVNVKPGHEFSLDLGITDLSQNKRNLLFSTSHKDLSVQPLSARVPFKTINRAIWTNLVFDLSVLINDIWKNQTFKSIDSITICANCKLRKIFTLKNPPIPDFGLSLEDSLPQVEFPQGTQHKIQIFSLNEQKSLDPNENIPDNSFNNQKTKANNVFKIAFGSKVSPILNSTQPKKPQSATIKLSNSQPLTPASQNTDPLNLSIKSNQIAPLSMSNGDLKSELNSNRKSLSEHNLFDRISKTSLESTTNSNRNSQDESSKNKKTTWNRVRPESQLIQTSQRKSLEIKQAQTIPNKIPHPPPQSTRPTSSSVRKIRLPNHIKNQQINNKTITYTDSLNTEDTNGNAEITTITLLNNPTYNKSKYSDNILNESINDLIQVLKTSSKISTQSLAQKSIIQAEKFSEITNLDDSGKTIVYSFSSKPKPVSLINSPTSQNNNEISKTSNFYDFRKYSSNHNLLSLVKDSLNNEDDSEEHKRELICEDKDFNLIDSFEARMLEEMKAEMENKKLEKNNNSSSLSQDEIKMKNLDTKNENLLNEIKSPDIGYFEAFQRGRSDLRSPLSDDNKSTSEKYNFDVMTSSIDDTTTSLSKRAVNMKAKDDENNYQDEMNISLLSNLPAKSINFKDFPAKYSPLLNQPQINSNKIQQIPISEEPPQYDDSQADIDEIISDSDEEIDLLYDPTLNCYYDPKTCTYYELNLS